MNGTTFTPQLESLADRLCPSSNGGKFLAGEMPRTEEEVGLIGLLRPGEEKGRAVDYISLIPPVPRHDGSAVCTVTFGGSMTFPDDVKVGEAGWDVKLGEERGAADDNWLVPAV